VGHDGCGSQIVKDEASLALTVGSPLGHSREGVHDREEVESPESLSIV